MTAALLDSLPRSSRILEVRCDTASVAPKDAGWNTYTVEDSTRFDPASSGDGVDSVWRNGPLIGAVPPALHGTFDALIAGHVIEQTLDLVAFLQGAASLLKPDGIILLAISDKRYCTDYFLPGITTGEVLEAHRQALTRPTERMTFDRTAYAVTNGGRAAWGQHPSQGMQLVHPLETALQRPETGGQRAWRFTPASFQLLLLELARLNLTHWRPTRVTEASGDTFYAWLRRGDRSAIAAMAENTFAARRLALLKRTLLETRAQIDWLLAGEPEIFNEPLALLPVTNEPPAPPPPAAPAQGAARYVDWLPARENAARAFEDEWSSAVPGLPATGPTPLFQDHRITNFEQRLGSFDGKQILELGPLEGGHTHMMTQRGATVTAIESNTRAWMRCLVVKDTLDMQRATFLLGDFVRYLATSPPKVDFLLASGVLYHMTDPVGVLHNMCAVSDAIGLWTHYFEPRNLQERAYREKFDFKPRQMTTPHGRIVELYGQRYLNALQWSGFCGGSAPGSNWLRRQDIIDILIDEGFDCEPFLDEPDHPNGPAFCVFARRRETGISAAPSAPD